MKILMTTDCVGGVWTYSLDLAKALEPHGVEVALATMGPPPSPDQRADAQRHPNVRLHESTFKLEWMDDPWSDVARAGRWLLDLEAALRPDVVHLNGYAHASFPFAAPIVVVAHSCVLSWWRAVKGEAAPASWNRYGQEVSRGLREADVVVAPSAAMAATLQENYGLARPPQVIHNGRDPSLFHQRRKQSFILAAGRLWDAAKNIAALERVAPDLLWPVCVAGEGGEANSSVLKLGSLPPPTLAGWMARADIYALPARYEPFGLSVLEAAMSGCTLVLGNIPSLREIWQDAAVYVPPDDFPELKLHLLDLIHEPRRRLQLSRRAKFHATRYSLDRAGGAYFSLYQSMLRRRAAIDAAASVTAAREAVPLDPPSHHASL